MTAAETFYRRTRATLVWPDFDRLAVPALALAVLASGLLLVHLSRGTSFWADDWIWIATRRGNTAGAFLAPYNGHLSLVPVAIYRLLFAVFGLSSYTPYRGLVIGLSLIVGVLVFVYARSRTNAWLAFLLAACMLFLGPGWQDTMWSFQIPWLVVCAAGVVSLMLVERRTRAADAIACALILLAICSTSLGLAFAVGIAVDLAVTRRRWRDAWIVAIPLILYIIWALHYHPSTVEVSAIPTVPLNVVQASAAALSVLAGLSGIAPFDPTGTSIVYGVPLLVLAVGLVLWRAHTTRLPARALSLAVTFVVFAVSVSVVHGVLASVLSSRYLYVYSLLAALLIAELVRGTRPSRLAQATLGALTVAAVLANIGSYRSSAAYFRQSGAATNGALSALDLDRASVTPSTRAHVALYQFVQLSARAYFAARRTLGTPAYTLPELQHATAIAQSSADSQLLADGDVTLTAAPSPAAAQRAGGPAPTAPIATGGSVSREGSCLRFTPAATLPPGGVASAILPSGPGRVSVQAGTTAATVSVRRFAPTFSALGTVAAGHGALITIRGDAAADPWYVQLSSIGPVRACRLGP